MDSSKRRKYLKIAAVAFWATVWFITAKITDNKLLIASPVDTVMTLIGMLGKSKFYVSVGGSLLRIMGGFAAGLLMAIFLSVAAVKYEWLEILLEPLVSLFRSVPVAAFVVILLIWYGPKNLAFIICFIIVFPGIYINMLEGIRATDKELLEMAVVHRITARNRLFYIYRPAIEPFLKAAMKNALGMCWKAGVAAEIIGMTDKSIGGQLYESKIYFDTAGVFAWAFVVIAISVICEKLVLRLLDKCFAIELACNSSRTEGHTVDNIIVEHIDKAFADQNVYKDYSAQFAGGSISVLDGVSGSGKTTLLKMIAGVINPDNGVIKADSDIGMVFQEDRLCENYSAVKNVAIVTGDEQKARKALEKVLDADCLDKPCVELSGGMKRRVAIVRAVESNTGILLFDEPFTGMDEQTIETVKKYINDNINDRVVIVATHI